VSAPNESIHFSNLQFIVIDDDETRPTAKTLAYDDTPQLTSDQKQLSQHELTNRLRAKRARITAQLMTQ
jgi:hypothetical protein